MKLIILDRDGVINYDSVHYIKSPQEWLPIPGSLEAIACLHQAGWTISIATNQSGIARGLYNHEVLTKIHQKMQDLVQAAGGKIDSIFYCPHHPSERCLCRKPAPGLLQKIGQHYKQNLAAVPFIGDKWTDVQTALAVKCQPILVQTGLEVAQQPAGFKIAEFANLKAVADHILKTDAAGLMA